MRGAARHPGSLVVSQGSFNLGAFAPAPSTIQQTYLFWAVSTLIFILTVTLGFMLFRTVVKLYIERQTNRPGSHIKSKLIGGALALSVLPIFFPGAVERVGAESQIWTNGSAGRRTTVNIDLVQIAAALNQEVRDKLTAQAHWLASPTAPERRLLRALLPGEPDREGGNRSCRRGGPRMLCSVSGIPPGRSI
jgi:two-component system nitrogen regulation sensor histidine kinase NtrY